LGNKRSLEKLIHGITKIPIQALRGNPFSDFSIAERKAWAAQRQTTEEEDIGNSVASWFLVFVCFQNSSIYKILG
jgi:hypothetical protein